MVVQTNKNKIVTMISPENFIRKKARTLPIHECWVNTNWKESQMVQTIISRKHQNGNITMCIYLVDLMCLGIKDTYYLYNLTESKYKEHIYNISENMAFEQCEYAIAHNIIFSGVKFATKFGFKPLKDFSSVTKYMLEEDNDKIESIHIECGENGQPLYMRGPYENDAKVQQIVNQLDKSAGEGNYRFIDDLNNDLDDELQKFWDIDLDDNDIEFENKYVRLSITEKLALFKTHMVRLDKLKKEEKIDFADLVESIIEHYIDQDKADEIYDLYFDKLDNYEITDEFSEEIVPNDSLSVKEADKLKVQFSELYDLIINDSHNVEKKLKPLINKYPNNPAICFLELTYLRLNESKEYNSILKEYTKKFPDYALIKLLNQINSYVTKTSLSNGITIESIIETYFPNRKVLNRIEVFHIFIFMFVFATKTKNIELLDALDFLMEETYLQEQELELLEYFVTMGKFEYILSKLEKNKN